ncbi:MAG TPA: helix-turn-helix domain-containing protein [Sporichthyaceae bacterium]|nr:helix-turn-helix domain-containing protein [Sporichthyaceae bacterium]
MAPGTRDRMIAAAARLFQRDGYAATGWRDVVEAGSTPWGSAHHHFPGGKEQLGAEAVALGSARVLAALEECLAVAPDVAAAVERWFALAATNLRDSQFECGCPVATVALETATSAPTLGAACADSFRSWRTRLRAAFEDAGIATAQADEFACQVLAALEGGLLLARTWREVRPLELAAAGVAAAIRAAPTIQAAPGPTIQAAPALQPPVPLWRPLESDL